MLPARVITKNSRNEREFICEIYPTRKSLTHVTTMWAIKMVDDPSFGPVPDKKTIEKVLWRGGRISGKGKNA